MLSLCIPTYNRLPYLKQCLATVIDKFGDYPYEVVIADGGSTDGTIEYLKNIGKDNVILIEQGKLTGIVKATNACFKKAKGDYKFIGNDDHTIVPKTLVNACDLMDKEEQIGLVSIKMQEPSHGNLHGVTCSKLLKYRTLLSKLHIFRSSVLKEINYFDEAFRSYFVDDDSTLDVLKRGYTTIYTRDIGVVHHRVRDESVNIAKAMNVQNTRYIKEFEYFTKKWEGLQDNVKNYLRYSPCTKYKSFFFRIVHDKMYFSERLFPFMKKHHKVSMAFFDWCLEQTVVFRDKDYDHLNDFFLPQKYPEDIISSLN